MRVELPPDFFEAVAHNEDECVEKECRFCDPRGAEVSTLRAQLAERDARIGELEAELLVITGAVEDAIPYVDDMQTRRELRAAIAKGTTDAD